LDFSKATEKKWKRQQSCLINLHWPMFVASLIDLIAVHQLKLIELPGEQQKEKKSVQIGGETVIGNLRPERASP